MRIVTLILSRGKMRLPDIISAMGVEEMTEKGLREAREYSENDRTQPSNPLID